MDLLKKEFDNFTLSDKIRYYQYIDAEIQKIKKEDPRKFSSVLYYVKDPEKSKVLRYKNREKVKQTKKISEIQENTLEDIINN